MFFVVINTSTSPQKIQTNLALHIINQCLITQKFKNHTPITPKKYTLQHQSIIQSNYRKFRQTTLQSHREKYTSQHQYIIQSDYRKFKQTTLQSRRKKNTLLNINISSNPTTEIDNIHTPQHQLNISLTLQRFIFGKKISKYNLHFV